MVGSRFLKNLFAVLTVAIVSLGAAQADIFTTANIGNDGYILRTPNGGGTSTVFSNDSQYNLVQGIGFNSQGTLFVANTGPVEVTGGGGLYTVDNFGVATRFKALDIAWTQGSIAFDPSDYVYVSEWDNTLATSFIRKINSLNGTIAASWSTDTAGEAPSSMAYNPLDGRLYVTYITENSIGYYDSDGDYSTYVSLDSYMLDYWAEGIAIDGDGNLYVSGGGVEQDQVIKIDTSLNITGYVTSDLSGALGLAWNGSALIIANQACGCGPINSLELSNGAGGATELSPLGEDYFPEFVAISVPEPSTFVLLGGALLGGFFYLRRRASAR